MLASQWPLLPRVPDRTFEVRQMMSDEASANFLETLISALRTKKETHGRSAILAEEADIRKRANSIKDEAIRARIIKQCDALSGTPH
jgi:hypothetical protein